MGHGNVNRLTNSNYAWQAKERAKVQVAGNHYSSQPSKLNTTSSIWSNPKASTYTDKKETLRKFSNSPWKQRGCTGIDYSTSPFATQRVDSNSPGVIKSHPKFGGLPLKEVFKATLAQEMSILGMTSNKPIDLTK